MRCLMMNKERYIMISLAITAAVGCSSTEPSARPVPEPTRQRQLEMWTVEDPVGPQSPVTTRPAVGRQPLEQPYVLNTENIIHILYHEAPQVEASRQSMVAAQYGLEEFKANLSRFEPFVSGSSTVSRFPVRRDAEGMSAEVVGGLEKETFDGAVYRVESGGSTSRFEFGEPDDNDEFVEEGSGGVIRGRIEIPFVGSRKRQSRVISAAYQESTARAAIIDYLTQYTQVVANTLQYYRMTLYYLGYVRSMEKKLRVLEKLLADRRTDMADVQRVESELLDTRVQIEQYRMNYNTYLLVLLEFLGIEPGQEYTLQEYPPEAENRYLAQARTMEGRHELLLRALENTPKFRVLMDAIDDAELKKEQAIQGKLDVTAYVEGTRFAFGSESYDDRVGGWQLNAGTSIRVNDPRVLNASRNKAEAEIRKYQSQIEALRMSIQRQIDTESAELVSFYDSRPQIMQNIEKSWAVFEQRMAGYLAADNGRATIDDVLRALADAVNADNQLNNNIYYASLTENTLMVATGDVYELVGLELEEKGDGTLSFTAVEGTAAAE